MQLRRCTCCALASCSFAKHGGACRLFEGALILLAIAAPWHVLATLRNPPYFDFTLKSEPGQYHGFFWFYFMNEHVFRFLNMRHPRDYNTVPRHLFWLFHLLWFFPWSVFLPGYFPPSLSTCRSGGPHAPARAVLDRLHHGVLHVFDDAGILLDAVLSGRGAAARLCDGRSAAIGARQFRHVAAIAIAAAATIGAILYKVWNSRTPGDISNALITQDSNAYTLSLGHMGDLTLASFAYLRVPLALAGVAFLIGVSGAWRFRQHRTYIALGCMMVLFLHAARLAMVTFDPYLSSRPLAEALLQAPAGQLIVDNQYYTFSSVFFYTNRRALLLNGRVNNLEYGSYAPDAPAVFIDDSRVHRAMANREPLLSSCRAPIGAAY